MRVYISCDMEGITGVTKWDETFITGDEEGFARARLQMTREVNAAVEGAVEAGATEALVCDAHGHGTSLLVEELTPEARLISGFPSRLGMVEGLDGSFDAAFFIGYHAQAGSPGVLNHSYTGGITHFRINGQVVGELGLGALMAWSQGVPAALVTGDDTTVGEAQRLLGRVKTVCTKESAGRYAAVSSLPSDSLARIKKVAGEAVGPEYLRSLTPLRVEEPVRAEVGFLNTYLAEQAARTRGAETLDSRSVAITVPTFPEAIEALLAMMFLGF